MIQITGYQFLRTISTTHAHVKKTAMQLQFRYDDISSVTTDTIKTVANEALKKSDLSRQLDLKTKFGTCSASDARTEKTLLKAISDSTDADSLNTGMTSLLSLYGKLSEAKA